MGLVSGPIFSQAFMRFSQRADIFTSVHALSQRADIFTSVHGLGRGPIFSQAFMRRTQE
jgi:hypothetical protein